MRSIAEPTIPTSAGPLTTHSGPSPPGTDGSNESHDPRIIRTMTLELFDTYAREVREFQPLHSDTVRMYACGPTVYDYAHIGNLRTYLFEDILRRILQFNGYKVKHILNITDVGHLTSDADTGEDKMEVGAERTGKTAWEIADLYTQAFKDDLQRLNILEPSIWCKATDHIQEQIDAIRAIEAGGYAYRTADGIYFDTSQLNDYGYLARLDVEGLRQGARVEIGDKRSVTDFALWKFSKPGQQRQMEWDSPWGIGFPGWHIECSAMSVKYLGRFFDIHCGGEDHIPVHHSNEIAQAQACSGTKLANFWMHGYFLQVDNTKMAKSSGEVLRLTTLLDHGYDPLAYRYLCLTAHYRSHLSFGWESLDSAETALNRLRNISFKWGNFGTTDDNFVHRFTQCINEDLNTPKALALTWELARSDLSPSRKKATLLHFDEVFGLRLSEWSPDSAEIPQKISALVQERETARSEKRWKDADGLRDQVYDLGFEIEDTSSGPEVKPRKR